MKKGIISFIAGALLFGTVGVFAGQYVATENPYPVYVNGRQISIQGYNINDNTYFKLRDLADAVAGFEVDFNYNNNSIEIAKYGYKYDSQYIHYPGAVSFAPDYKYITGAECTGEIVCNDLTLLYGAGFEEYYYKSSPFSAKRYTNVLQELGFERSKTNPNIYSKNNNYVEMEIGTDTVSVTLYLQYNPETNEKF